MSPATLSVRAARATHSAVAAANSNASPSSSVAAARAPNTSATRLAVAGDADAASAAAGAMTSRMNAIGSARARPPLQSRAQNASIVAARTEGFSCRAPRVHAAATYSYGTGKVQSDKVDDVIAAGGWRTSKCARAASTRCDA